MVVRTAETRDLYQKYNQFKDDVIDVVRETTCPVCGAEIREEVARRFREKGLLKRSEQMRT